MEFIADVEMVANFGYEAVMLMLPITTKPSLNKPCQTCKIRPSAFSEPLAPPLPICKAAVKRDLAKRRSLFFITRSACSV
jgi:hypothetical protein